MLRNLEQDSIVVIEVRVTPRGGRNTVIGFDGTTLALRVAAPPVEGAANRACIDLLAELLNVRRARISLIGGAVARNKRFAIADMTLTERDAKLRIVSVKENG